MDKLQKSAKGFEIFFHVLQILFTIAAIIFLVWLGFFTAGVLFDLPPELFADMWNTLDFSCFTLTLAQSATPAPARIMAIAIPMLAVGLALSILVLVAIRLIRRLLQSMVAGEPFPETAARDLTHIAIYTFIGGALYSILELVTQIQMVGAYNLTELLRSESILQVAVQYELDVSFIVYGLLLLLLSYVFRYGALLQQADETL